MAKALKLPTARGNALAAPVGGHDKPQANERCAAAIDSPSDLSGHKTPRQDIDALKEPDGPHQRHQNAHDVQNNSHHFRPVPTHLTSLSLHLYVTAPISDKTSACCPLQKG